MIKRLRSLRSESNKERTCNKDEIGTKDIIKKKKKKIINRIKKSGRERGKS